MKKKIFILLFFIAMVMNVPIAVNSAKNITIDTRYNVTFESDITVEITELISGTDIIEQNLFCFQTFGYQYSLDGGEITEGSAYIPKCDAGFWLVEKVEKVSAVWLDIPTYRLYLKQAYPLTFKFTDVGTADYMTFAFAGSTDCSNVNDFLPQRVGYSFLGWYTEDDTQIYDANGQFIVGDSWNEQGLWIGNSGMTLYPKWNANTYTVSFDANGGSSDAESMTVTFDSSYGSMPVPQKFGFTFTGWFTEPEDGTRMDENTPVSIPRDHTLYAHWQADVNTITAIANEQYGTAVIPESAATGDLVNITATPITGCRLDRILVYRTDDPTQTVNVDSENRFLMPGYPVTVEVVFVQYQYDIKLNLATPDYGTVSVDRSAAGVGDVVTIAATPNKGYTLEVLTVTPTNPAYTVTVEQDGTFLMPPCPVTVDVSFVFGVYTITVQTPEEGKGTVEVNQTQASYGDQITVTAQPVEGYAIRSIVLIDKDGKETNISESFTMPNSNITIKVNFMVIPTYTVTIPATVSLNSQPMALSVDNTVMEEGLELQVLLHTDLTVRTTEGAVNTYSINDGVFTDGSAVLLVDGGGTPAQPKNDSVELYFTRDAEPQYSGEYKGTISFTIRTIDTAFVYQ